MCARARCARSSRTPRAPSANTHYASAQLLSAGDSNKSWSSIATSDSQVPTVTAKVSRSLSPPSAFDARGNRTSVAVVGGMTTNLAYDQANRLAAYGSTATYGYNGDGLRMTKTVSGTTQAFTWEVAEGLPLIVQDGSTSYVTGPGGLPLEQISGTTVYYYHSDQLGSTRAMTDAPGTVQQRYEYDSFGSALASSGTLTNQFRYGGQYLDAESSIYYLRARNYDPATSQFLTADPLMSSVRVRYSYSGNSPTNLVDPSGLCAMAVGFICFEWPAPPFQEGFKPRNREPQVLADPLPQRDPSVLINSRWDHVDAKEGFSPPCDNGLKVVTSRVPGDAGLRILSRGNKERKHELSDNLHSIKDAFGLSGRDATEIETNDGSVFNKTDGSLIGNVFEG